MWVDLLSLEVAEGEVPLVVVATVVAGSLGVLVWTLWCGSRRVEKASSTQVLWGTASMWETMSQMTNPNCIWFLLEQVERFRKSQEDEEQPVVFRLPMPVGSGFTVVADGALARQLLSDPKAFKPSQFYGLPAKAMAGDDNLFGNPSSCPQLKLMRKGVAAPAFATKQVKQRMNQICNNHAVRWTKETLEPLILSNATFDPSVEMTQLTLKVIVDAAFDYSEATDAELQNFARDLETGLRELGLRQVNNPFRRALRLFVPEHHRAMAATSRMQRFAQHMLDSYREKHKTTTSEGSSAATTTVMGMIANHPELTEKQRVAEIVILLIAGHDTTGYSLSNTLCLLAEQPDVVQKLRLELRKVEDENWSQCDYLQHVIRESFRLHPVAALGPLRRLGRDFAYSTGKQEQQRIIPKGTDVTFPLLAIHRNPVAFGTTADVFDPSRWQKATPAMDANLLPFAVGPRNCVGQALAMAEMQTVLARLVLDYDFVIQQKGYSDFFLTFKIAGCQMRAQPAATTASDV